MDRQRRRIKNKSNGNTSISTEAGFTYLELIISLLLFLVLLPAIFFVFHTIVMDAKKTMAQERLQMDWMNAYHWMQREIKQGDQYQIDQEGLIFSLPTGEQVKYKQKGTQLIRQVKKPEWDRFQGHTLLLINLDTIHFIPDKHGVRVNVALQDGHASLPTYVYIHRRVGRQID